MSHATDTEVDDRLVMQETYKADQLLINELEVKIRGSLTPRIAFSFVGVNGSGLALNGTLLDVLYSRRGDCIVIVTDDFGSRRILPLPDIFAISEVK